MRTGGIIDSMINLIVVLTILVKLSEFLKLGYLTFLS